MCCQEAFCCQEYNPSFLYSCTKDIATDISDQGCMWYLLTLFVDWRGNEFAELRRASNMVGSCLPLPESKLYTELLLLFNLCLPRINIKGLVKTGTA